MDAREFPDEMGEARRTRRGDGPALWRLVCVGWWHRLWDERWSGRWVLLPCVVVVLVGPAFIGRMWTPTPAGAVFGGAVSVAFFVYFIAHSVIQLLQHGPGRTAYVVMDPHSPGRARSVARLHVKRGSRDVWVADAHYADPPRAGWGSRLRRALAGGLGTELDRARQVLELQAVSDKMATVYEREFDGRLARIGLPDRLGRVTLRRSQTALSPNDPQRPRRARRPHGRGVQRRCRSSGDLALPRLADLGAAGHGAETEIVSPCCQHPRRDGRPQSSRCR